MANQNPAQLPLEFRLLGIQPGKWTVETVISRHNGLFRKRSGASFRVIVDVGHWDNSVATNNPGHSGNPESSHYRDLLEGWATGRHFPLLYSPAKVEAAAEAMIVLKPEGEGGEGRE